MQRPISVLVLGILNIVLGGLGILSLLLMIPLQRLSQHAAAGNPVLKLMQENANYALFMKVSMLLGIIASVVLLLAGVGLLQVKPWARYLSIGYAVYGIIAAIVGAVANVVFLSPLVEQASRMPMNAERGAMIGSMVGGTIGGCVSVVYPVILLIFMFRANVKAAMKPAGQAPGA